MKTKERLVNDQSCSVGCGKRDARTEAERVASRRSFVNFLLV